MTSLTIQIPDDIANGLIAEAAFRHLSPAQVAAERLICHAPARRPESSGRSYASYFGAAKGVYGSPDAVDRAIEEIRNEW